MVQFFLLFHSGLEWDDSVDVVLLQIVGGAGPNKVTFKVQSKN
jgi:hypothetical protein